MVPSTPAAVSGATQVAGVIGRPIRHSLSPAIYNAAFAAAGLDWIFVAWDVGRDEIAAALAGARALGVRGLSVTMPLKDDVAGLVDDLTPAAAALGAVNSVALVEGRLVGHNTDGPGFVDSLRADGVEPAGCRVAVLGAGGAARAVVAALADAGAAEVAVIARRADRAARAAALAGGCGHVADPADVAGVDVVVNATPVGMAGDTGLPLDPALLHDGQTVVDLVYHPLETPWLASCRARGLRAVNGVGMLVHQAAHQYRSWTGQEPPVAVMEAAVAAALLDQG